MTGSATFASSGDAAGRARQLLDTAAEAARTADSAQRDLLASLVELWPTSAWIAAGATSAKRWLVASTGCSEPDAHRLERLARLCHRHPTLADAVLSGELSLARAHRLGLAVTPEREPWLADSLPALLRLNARRVEDEDWSAAVRHWVGLVDQERDVRGVPRHTLTLSARLFGGGEVHADLSPVAYANVAAALDAWTDDPDPTDAAHQRGLGERRADALDDLCRHALTGPDDDLDLTGDTDDPEFEDITARDTFDGFSPTDTLDEQLDTDDVEEDVLGAIRRRLRRAEQHRRRRTLVPQTTPHHRRPRPALRLPLLHPTTPPLRHPPPRPPLPRRTDQGRQRRAAVPVPPPTPPPRLAPRHPRRHWTATDPHGTTWTGQPTRGDPP